LKNSRGWEGEDDEGKGGRRGRWSEKRNTEDKRGKDGTDSGFLNFATSEQDKT
jgi:hypothetical protein